MRFPLILLLLAPTIGRADDAAIRNTIEGVWGPNRAQAIRELIAVGAPAVPIVVPMLADRHLDRYPLMDFLAHIGTAAVPAIPALIGILHEDSNDLGLTVLKAGDIMTPDRVYWRGAGQTGLKPGDWIVAIFDKPTSGMTPEQFNTKLAGYHGAASLTVRKAFSHVALPLPRGFEERGSVAYGPPLSVDINSRGQDVEKYAALSVLVKIGPRARAALPEIRKLLAVPTGVEAWQADALTRDTALVAISQLEPSTAGGVPALTRQLRDRDPIVRDVAWTKLSYRTDLPQETLYMMREKIKRVMISNRGRSLPMNFPLSLYRVACAHRTWGAEIAQDADGDVAGAMTKVFGDMGGFPAGCSARFNYDLMR